MTTTTETTTTATNGKGRKPKRSRVPDGEKKEEKFVRLAEQRMSAVQSKIRQVKNLARYPHTEAQAMKIVEALKAMAADIEAAFKPREKPAGFSF